MRDKMQRSGVDPTLYHSMRDESGQSIVLIALLLIGLLAFAGLATDVGMLFARSSQFSAAVDAATLAGVVDLGTGLGAAQQRAEEFLDANRWPVSRAITSTASESTSALGYPELTYTVTYPVEPYFLVLLGFDAIPISHSATAAVYSRADMPTATQTEAGILRTAGQYIYGPDSCTTQGDPIASRWSNNGVPNPLWTETGGKYTYRIRIPEDFSADLDVQLFDPDSLNTRFGPTDSAVPGESCSTSGNGDSCFIPTGEPSNANPVWLHRMDETWAAPAPGGSFCPSRDSSNPNSNTITRYDLFRLDSDGNRVDVSSFTTGSATDLNTDLRWVTPGETAGIPAMTGTFRVNAGSVPVDGTGYRNLYLDVSTTAGSSKNGWDLWAGPSSMLSGVPADGNLRNEHILGHLDSFSTEGIEIFAQGYLPTSSYYFAPPSLPVAAVDEALGGNSLAISVFDFEPPAEGPFDFNFSTMAPSDRPSGLAAPRVPQCNGSFDCNNQWVEPQFRIPIPSIADGVPFYGGYLQATYGMNSDEHTWSATLPLGRPFLTR